MRARVAQIRRQAFRKVDLSMIPPTSRRQALSLDSYTRARRVFRLSSASKCAITVVGLKRCTSSLTPMLSSPSFVTDPPRKRKTIFRCVVVPARQIQPCRLAVDTIGPTIVFSVAVLRAGHTWQVINHRGVRCTRYRSGHQVPQ